MDVTRTIPPSDTSYGIAMHCGSGGSNKDWIGYVTRAGVIHTFWGKADGPYQAAMRVGNKAAFDALVKEKLAKGYIAVDLFDAVAHNWTSQQGPPKQKKSAAPQLPPIPPPAPPAPKNITTGVKPPDDSVDWDF